MKRLGSETTIEILAFITLVSIPFGYMGKALILWFMYWIYKTIVLMLND